MMQNPIIYEKHFKAVLNKTTCLFVIVLFPFPSASSVVVLGRFCLEIN